MVKSGGNVILSWSQTDSSLETSASLDPQAALWAAIPGSSPVTFPANAPVAFFRLKKSSATPQVARTQTPWLILLCKFQDNQTDPPVADFIPLCQRLFTSAG